MTANPTASTTTPPVTNTTTTNIPKITAFPALAERELGTKHLPDGCRRRFRQRGSLRSRADRLDVHFLGHPAGRQLRDRVAHGQYDGLQDSRLPNDSIRQNGKPRRRLPPVSRVVTDFNRGDPTVHANSSSTSSHPHGLRHACAALLRDRRAGRSQPGHINFLQTGIGDSGQKRTWP